MKKMRKIFALLIAMVMVLGMSTAVFAAGTPSITINPNNDDQSTESVAITYTYYKILTASIDTDPTVGSDGSTTADGKVAYYVENQDQATALSGLKVGTAADAPAMFTVTQVPGQQKWYVELADSATTAEQIIAAFDNATFLANFTEQTYTKDANTASAVLPNVTAGYYFIKSSLGTKAAVQTLSPVTINEKNSYPGIVKEFGTAGTDTTNNLAGIGDTISYKVEVTIPESVAEKEIKVVDTITDGLTLNTTATVTGAVADPAYTSATFVQTGTNAAVVDDPATTDVDETKKGSKEYTITIPAATVIANKGKTLTFTYTATVNTAAVVLDPESNTAHLEYDQFVTVDTEPVETKTLAFDIQKVDGTDHTTVLTGAEFKLYDALTGGNEIKVVALNPATTTLTDGTVVNMYRLATADETGVVIQGGTARIEGLNDKTYYLEETKAPTGYNKLTERVAITASESTSTTTIDVKIDNNKGTQLPSTGGIGTTIFYVVGALLIVGAGIIMVTRRRMDAQ